MQEFILQQNIARYRHLLDKAVSEAERKTIVKLLVEEESKLAQMMQARAKQRVAASQK